MPWETLDKGIETENNFIKNALKNLEESVWWRYFKNAVDWLKSTFWLNKKDWQAETWNQCWSQNEQPSSGPDYSKVDRTGFTPWKYPFAHIKTPYKGISSYRVDNRELNPLIGFSQLRLSWTEGNFITLKVKDLEEKIPSWKNNPWVRKKNPCNISHSWSDIWYKGSSKVADWQNHGEFETMIDWLASYMRLMRSEKYRNKSIQGINCSWMQGKYNENEPDSLKALRISWITHACENLHVSPFERLNTDDKETMMALTQQTAINETSCRFSRNTLEKAYERAFNS